jgi:hypothetical protein
MPCCLNQGKTGFNNLVKILGAEASPQEKIDKIKTSCKTVIENHCITIRTLASLIGLIIHAFNAVSYGQLHYRNLERDKIKHLRINYDDFNVNVCNSSITI